MYCHVCDENVPLDRVEDHVRVLHPDAWPIDPVILVDC